MRCDVAREELSARLDGERPRVLAQQVDAHLESCRRCRAWLIDAAAQTRRFAAVNAGTGPDLADRIMATAGVAPPTRYRRWPHALGPGYWRWCLIAVGVFQIAMAAAQIGGIDFGIMSHHGHDAMMHGEHLLHESTAWLLALGLAMIVAAVWSNAALGVAAIAGAYSLALMGYVAVDAWHGEVTAARIASHVPLLAGTVFALLVARDRSGAPTSQPSEHEPAAPVRPAALTPGRRHGHLRPINRSTTAGRMHGEPCRLRRSRRTDRLAQSVDPGGGFRHGAHSRDAGGQRRTCHHHHRNIKGRSGIQLGPGHGAAAVLGDQRVDVVLS